MGLSLGAKNLLGDRMKRKLTPAVLTPNVTEFNTSLELTFTVFDGADVYYTLDGTTPSISKTKYTTPFTITATKTVKWITIHSPYINSNISSRTITKL